MYRFIAFDWNNSDTGQAETVRRLRELLLAFDREWTVAYDGGGLMACHTGLSGEANRAYPLRDNAGVVLGKIFSSSRPSNGVFPEPIFDAEKTEAALNTRGRNIVDCCWGSYVAFIKDAENERTHVVRAPVGRLPCLFVNVDGVRIFFSRTEDCVKLGVMEFAPDWSYLLRHLVTRGAITISGTGLSKVSQVLPGECVTVSQSGEQRSTYWDPSSIALSDGIEDFDEAVRLLRSITDGCIAAWASGHRSILVLLSGGLDSSIVTSCAARAPSKPRVTCLNHVTPTVEGDEREFARLAAKRAGVELHEEIARLGERQFEDVSLLERTAIPLGNIPAQPGGSEIKLAQKVNATAVFSGQYGDSVFLEGFIEHTTADYLLRNGFRSGLIRVAYHEARMRQLTLWSVLSQALKSRKKTPRLTYISDLRDDFALLTPEAKASVDLTSLQPTILGNIDEVPRGKLIQILTCFQALRYHDPFGDTTRPEQIHVLGSQPLLEVSFRIPTYVLNTNGVGRAVARRAFANELPDEIVNRRTKGTSTRLQRDFLANNWEFLRSMLLDGRLVEEGILDRRMLEASLSSPDSISASIAAELRVALSTEVWARSWEGAEKHRAVA